MKPIPAIVEKLVVSARDIDLAREHIVVELAGEIDDNRIADRHEKQAAAARESAKARRLRIGAQLAKVRPTWPARGPAPKDNLPAGAPASWGEFLASVKLDDATARRYMDEYRDPEGFAQKQRSLSETPDPEPAAEGDRGAPQLSLTPDSTTANVHGGSGERRRGSYCTPRKWALAVGPWDLDPFSNPHSHIAAERRCMLENGGDGLVDQEQPGSWREGGDHPPGVASHGVAGADTRVWIQPDYRIVLKAIAHYGHARFCALLRFAPDTRWFRAMWPRVAVIAVPMERIPFETPDGIEIAGADEGEDAGAPFPHVLYYSDPRDVTEEIARLCILLTRYEALRLVP